MTWQVFGFNYWWWAVGKGFFKSSVFVYIQTYLCERAVPLPSIPPPPLPTPLRKDHSSCRIVIWRFTFVTGMTVWPLAHKYTARRVALPIKSQEDNEERTMSPRVVAGLLVFLLLLTVGWAQKQKLRPLVAELHARLSQVQNSTGELCISNSSLLCRLQGWVWSVVCISVSSLPCRLQGWVWSVVCISVSSLLSRLPRVSLVYGLLCYADSKGEFGLWSVSLTLLWHADSEDEFGLWHESPSLLCNADSQGEFGLWSACLSLLCHAKTPRVSLVCGMNLPLFSAMQTPRVSLVCGLHLCLFSAM